MPPLLADFIHARACKPICEKSLTLPSRQGLQTFLRKILDTTLLELANLRPENYTEAYYSFIEGVA